MRLPSGVLLIDQLVWKAFERQGYQLIAERGLAQPPFGTARVMIKEGVKAVLLFVGHGPFFEKQTVERFIRVMREAGVEQGFLVASGSFTVPAQRLAKEHHVALIGREQLTELLSTGAGSEYFAKQLEQSRVRLDEAKETLNQYAAELETLRRQRNEASWCLGEERARAAQLEAQLAELGEQINRHHGEIQRWEREAAALRKQWEESEWYLGESKARIRHLETQLTAMQDQAGRLETAERERREAQHTLGEERARRLELEVQLADLQKRWEESQARERVLQDAVLELQVSLTQLKEELKALQAFGDRRAHPRAEVPQATIEVRDGQEGEPLFAGPLRDVSASGVGVTSDQELPVARTARVRLSFPGREPIESKSRLIWQRAAEGPSLRYRSGFRLLGLSSSTRAAIEQLIWELQASRT
jgi:predicted  nucleic acid-binding Zn-ribbon protein